MIKGSPEGRRVDKVVIFLPDDNAWMEVLSYLGRLDHSDYERLESELLHHYHVHGSS